MLVVLIVVPAVIVAVAVVVVLDRLGVLPRLDGGPSVPSGRFLESVPNSALYTVGAVMALWILAWIVFLVIGLSVLAG
jgi:hypothetical protein